MRVPWFAFVTILAVPPWAAAQTAADRGVDTPATVIRDEGPASSGTTHSSTVGSLFASFWQDLKHLPSTSNAITLATGGALALAAHPADRTVTAHAIASDGLEDMFDAGAAGGSGWLQVGGAFGAYIFGRHVGNEALASVGASLIHAQVLNTLVTESIKVAVHRTRPDQGNFSFPSGHASASFATATVLERTLGWKFGVPAYGVAAYVGGSRVQGNQHYASDVIFGAAVGIVAGRTVAVGHGAGKFDVAPMATPGGIGVSFTRER